VGPFNSFFSEATTAEPNGLLPFSQLFFEKPPLTATFPATFPKNQGPTKQDYCELLDYL
jgi:hypothetical protein